MVFEDTANILLLCILMGVGAGLTIAVLLAYIAALAFMEDHFD
jgi:phage shock protein PspC (stress-responsive transcriptional regulator)